MYCTYCTVEVSHVHAEVTFRPQCTATMYRYIHVEVSCTCTCIGYMHMYMWKFHSHDCTCTGCMHMYMWKFHAHDCTCTCIGCVYMQRFHAHVHVEVSSTRAQKVKQVLEIDIRCEPTLIYYWSTRLALGTLVFQPKYLKKEALLQVPPPSSIS